MGRFRKTFFLFVVVSVIVIALSGSVSALSPLDVLIVSDGHTLSDPDLMPEDRFLPRYKEAIQPLDNVEVDVYHTNASGNVLGPSAEKMDEYDVVVWYSLQDFEGNPSELCSGEVCTVFHGDSSSPGSGGGDVQNITDYLQTHRGRIFVTGHRVHFQNRKTNFEEDIFKVLHGSTDRQIYECRENYWGFLDCDEESKNNINNVLMGEADDPVTRDSFFRPSLDTEIEPEGQRGIFVADQSPFVSDENFRWRHKNEDNDRFYALDIDGDEYVEEYTHSMVRTNMSNYKSVYAGFGFEAIKSSSDRQDLMRWTLNYLAGPRVDNTEVSDSSSSDYPKYTKGKVDVSSTCLNRQIQTGTEVSKAEMLVQSDTGIQDPRIENGKYPLNADDGYFGESTEDVSYTDYDAAGNINIDLGNYPEGYNQSYGVHCRDSTSQKYWGQFEKDWVIVDTEVPVAPGSVSFTEDYTDTQNNSLTVNYQRTADGYKADLVRFSCSTSGPWTDWRVYDPSKAPGTTAPDEKSFEVNVTRNSMGCTGPETDGNRTIHVDVRDYANNTASTMGSDWIILDRKDPEFRSLEPGNLSYIQEDELLRINATDENPFSTGDEAPNNTFYNETLNQSFIVNNSFDPDYSGEGGRSLSFWVFDKASNVVSNFFRFTVDVAPPTVDAVTPGNGSYLAVDDNLTLNASDDWSFSHLTAYNGSHNTTFDSKDVELDLGWTSEILHNLTIWVNDSAGNTASYRYEYTVDDTPPSITGIDPGNESYILNSTKIEVNVSDSGAGTGILLYNNGTGTDTFSSGSGIDPSWTSEGEHDLDLKLNDTVGNLRSLMYRYTVDEKPPSSSTSYSWQSWESSNKTVNLNATDNFQLSGIRYCTYSEGENPCNPSSFSPGNISLEVGCTDGETCVKYTRFRSNDSAGHLEDVQTSENVSIDKQPPTVDFQTLKDGDTVAGTIDLNVTVSDEGIGGSPPYTYSVVNKTPNGLEVIETGELNRTGFDTNLRLTNATTTAVFNVSASDDLGNSLESNVTFEVDNQRVVTSITSPDEVHLNSDFSLEADAKRPGGYVRNMTYNITNSTHTIIEEIRRGINASSDSFDKTLDVNDSWTDGNHTLMFKAWDNDTVNPTRSVSETWFYLDRKPPELSIDSPSNGTWQTGEITIEYAAIDQEENGTVEWRWKDGTGWNGNFSLNHGNSSFPFETSDCDDDSSPDCKIELNQEDLAGNTNTSSVQFKVDNTDPLVSLDSPEENSWHSSDFTINASDSDNIAPLSSLDCNWKNRSSGWQSRVCNSSFSVDISTFCSVEGKESCEVKLETENPAGLTETTVFHEFSIDTSLPNITDVSPENYSIINSSQNITLDFEDEISGVDVALRNNGTGNDTFLSGSDFDPGWEESQEEKLVVWLNDSANNLLEQGYSYRVDTQAPVSDDARFNISRDEVHGDYRLYRGDTLEFRTNISDDFNISSAEVAINFTGTSSAENRSLQFKSGNNTDAVWSLEYEDTGAVGVYNVSNLYLYDSASHLNVTTNELPEFRVVNHSLSTELGGGSTVQAGHEEEVNMTVDLNRTTSPFLRIFIPPSDPSNLVEPVYTNTTSYNCSFGNAGCSLVAGYKGGEIAYLNVSTTGSNTSVDVTANVTAPIPEKDTTHTWTSSIGGNNQKASTSVKTPFLNVSGAYCAGNNDCNVSQKQEFDLDVEVANENTPDHTGLSEETLVEISQPDLGISNFSSEGTLGTDSSINSTFTLNITEAGTFEFDVNASENFTENYWSEETITVDVADIIPPNASGTGLDKSTINVGGTVSIDSTARDNIEVAGVKATFLNTTGPAENVSLSLEGGDKLLGSWAADYSSTSTKGIYNITKLFVEDAETNTYVKPLNLSFEVSRLRLGVGINTTDPSFHSPVKITSNATGNSTSIDRVEANITKPRGAYETLDLNLSSYSGGYIYEGVYKNTSRSGPYNVNVTVEGGATVHNASESFDTPFGEPQPRPLHGNGTHLLLPTGTSPNMKWDADPVKGDLEDANTSLSISNTSVVKLASGEKGFEHLDNVTYEEGARRAGYDIDAVSTGNATLNFSVNTTRSLNFTTVVADVKSSDTTDPRITGFNETPDLANKEQNIIIEANASDLSVLQNMTVMVKHPESGSNATESPEKMEQEDRGSYRYVFSNTNETGHYTYTLKTWDIAGNLQENVSESFNVTSNYTVNVNSSYGIYRKAEEGVFNVEVEDATGDPVSDYNLTMVLDKSGSNTTLLPYNETSSESYTFQDSDPPDESILPSNLPVSYTVHVNVSGGGNTGRSSHDFDVTRRVNRDNLFQNPQQSDNIAPGEDFNITLDVDYPRGDPVTGAVVYVRCNKCPSDFKFLDYEGNGVYSEIFTAPTDDEGAVLRAFVDDGLGNSESQEEVPTDVEPTISIDITEDTEATTDTTSTTDGGGGGGGGGAVPSLDISRISPDLNLPANTSEINLSVKTDLESSCQYSLQGAGGNSSFSTNGGKIHFDRVEVGPGRSYSYEVICQTPDDLSSDTTVAFSVASEKRVSYQFKVPEEPIRTVLGGNASAQVNLFNNGTERLEAVISSQSSCCDTGFTTLRGKNIEEIAILPEAGRVVQMRASVPMNISLGKKTVLVQSRVEERTRERTIVLDVRKGGMIERLENLVNRSSELQEEIDLYRRTGVDTSDLEEEYTRLQDSIMKARRAKSVDNRSEFLTMVERSEERAESIERGLQVLSLRQYVLANWWRWALAGGGMYIMFFLITMVVLPYYRLRTELLNIEEDLDASVDARKKAEKQYFQREIDRDTFMNIMTERQDEILELRGQKQDIEEELDNLLQNQISIENFLKAPLKAFREVSGWWKETWARYFGERE